MLAPCSAAAARHVDSGGAQAVVQQQAVAQLRQLLRETANSFVRGDDVGEQLLL